MELVVCYGDGKVSFCFAAGGETGEQLGVEQGNPDCLRGGPPVEEGEEGAGGVIKAWVLDMLALGRTEV